MLKKNPKLCYLCGEPGADSKDHIPPKGLFTNPIRGQLITLPAHIKCNHDFARDDSEFRDMIIAASFRTPEGQKAWKEKVIEPTRARKRNLSNIQKVVRPVWIKDVMTDAFIRQYAVFQDASLMDRQIERFTRGLYYNHFRRPLPAGCNLEVYKAQPAHLWADQMVRSLDKFGIYVAWKEPVRGEFRFVFLPAQDAADVSMSVFVFYETETYVGNTGLPTEDEINIERPK